MAPHPASVPTDSNRPSDHVKTSTGQHYGATIRDIGRWEHASAGRPTLEPWAASPSRYLAARAARPDALRARIRSCRVPAGSLLLAIRPKEHGEMIRIIGLDIHRVFAEAVMLDDGKLTRLGRIGMTRKTFGSICAHADT